MIRNGTKEADYATDDAATQNQHKNPDEKSDQKPDSNLRVSGRQLYAQPKTLLNCVVRLGVWLVGFSRLNTEKFHSSAYFEGKTRSRQIFSKSNFNAEENRESETVVTRSLFTLNVGRSGRNEKEMHLLLAPLWIIRCTCATRDYTRRPTDVHHVSFYYRVLPDRELN